MGMMDALPYPEEAQRLASVKKLHLLDTPIEERFERITRMVCKALNMPIAIFNLIDQDRQYYKSVRGLTATEASLKGAFCTHALHEENMLLVPNTANDERFSDNPFVDGTYLNVGFYAGCPIRTPDGMPVGTLCAIDTKPRDLTHEELETLKDLAGMVETELRLSSISKSQSEMAEKLDNATRLAMIDVLTRLWNRGGLEKLIAKEWSEAIRQQKPITVVIADVDRFKSINDQHGHPGGDAVLRDVAKKLVECARSEDIVGRWGGEEFVILLTNCQPDMVAQTLERFRASVEALEIEFEGRKIPVTMSFGAATLIPSQSDASDALIAKADAALYEAKNSGRNRVIVTT